MSAATRAEGPPLARFRGSVAAHPRPRKTATGYPAPSTGIWRGWVEQLGLPPLQPRRWMYLNYAHQQVQAAMAGQAVALARLSFVAESLARGELVEPFGEAGRVRVPGAYWLVSPQRREPNDDVRDFADWVQGQAALTRVALGELPVNDGLNESD